MHTVSLLEGSHSCGGNAAVLGEFAAEAQARRKPRAAPRRTPLRGTGGGAHGGARLGFREFERREGEDEESS